MEFLPDAEDTFNAAMEILKDRGFVSGGQLLAVVQSGRQPIWRSSSMHGIQVRPVPMDVNRFEASGDVDYLGPGAQLKRSLDMRGSKRSQEEPPPSGNALP